MTDIFVVYDSKYGNTKLAAENIAVGIQDVTGDETSVGDVKDIEVGAIAGFDALVLGSPNHMAKPSRTMLKFVDALAKANLKTKYVAVFGTTPENKETLIEL